MKDTEGSPFYTPFTNFLIKSDESDPYIIYIEASNENPDSQKDIVFMKALQNQKDYFLRKGIITWDHLHKIEGSPDYIVGEPLEVRFDENNKRTFVKAKLYKGVKYAQSIVDLLKAKCTRLGASIGGYIRKRKQLSKTLSGVTNVIWNELAITYKEVNDTLDRVSMIPIGAFAKALMAGTGVNAETFTGGRALIRENLDNIMAELVWRMKEGDIKTDDDLKDFLAYKSMPQLYGLVGRVITKKFSGR